MMDLSGKVYPNEVLIGSFVTVSDRLNSDIIILS